MLTRRGFVQHAMVLFLALVLAAPAVAGASHDGA